MLRIVPVSLRTANAYVEKRHRHHKPVTGHKFSIGCTNAQDELVGVAIVGGLSAAISTTGKPLRSTVYALTEQKTPAVCCTPQHGGQRRLWAIAKSLHISLIPKAAQACAPQAGAVPGLRAASVGRAAVVLLPTSIRHR